MISSRMSKQCHIELAIVLIFLNNIADAEVNISAITPPNNGETVILTCNISAFTLPASWKNNDNGAYFTTCSNAGTCIPSSDGVRYNFTSTSLSIIVTISRFNSAVDTFTWKCEHGGTVATYRIIDATTQSAITRMLSKAAKEQRPCHLLILLVSVLLVMVSLF